MACTIHGSVENTVFFMVLEATGLELWKAASRELALTQGKHC